MDKHIDDDTLDGYALGKPGEDDLAIIEEHLLVCQICQERLALTDEFIAALRAPGSTRFAVSRKEAQQ